LVIVRVGANHLDGDSHEHQPSKRSEVAESVKVAVVAVVRYDTVGLNQVRVVTESIGKRRVTGSDDCAEVGDSAVKEIV